jgi:hypothetical protein
LLFLVPALVAPFLDRLPNSVWLWRIVPQGMPGLVVGLMFSALSATAVMVSIGANPEFAAWSTIVLSLVGILTSVPSWFGREGAVSDEVRFSQRNPWVFRLGGVLVLLIALRLMGVA